MDLQSVLEVLGRCRALRDVTISDYSPDLSKADLWPITNCEILLGLEIRIEGEVRMSDEEVGELMRHLPRLQCLRLRQDEESVTHVTPNTTLRALAIVAAACPLIEEISMGVDCNPANIPTDLPTSRHQSLQDIDAYHSPLVDSSKSSVAMYLASLSDVATFSFTGHHRNYYINDLWSEVSEMVQTIRMAHQQTTEHTAVLKGTES